MIMCCPLPVCRPPITYTKKSSPYMALLASPESDHGQSDLLDVVTEVGVASMPEAERHYAPGKGSSQGGGGFKWKTLEDGNVDCSPADGSGEKGHSRSTSLDLNKMMLGSDSECVCACNVCLCVCVRMRHVCVLVCVRLML